MFTAWFFSVYPLTAFTFLHCHKLIPFFFTITKELFHLTWQFFIDIFNNNQLSFIITWNHSEAEKKKTFFLYCILFYKNDECGQIARNHHRIIEDGNLIPLNYSVKMYTKKHLFLLFLLFIVQGAAENSWPDQETLPKNILKFGQIWGRGLGWELFSTSSCIVF